MTCKCIVLICLKSRIASKQYLSFWFLWFCFFCLVWKEIFYQIQRENALRKNQSKDGNNCTNYALELNLQNTHKIMQYTYQACPFGTSDVRDYSIWPPDLPLMPSTSPTDLPGHISASTRLRKKYDLSIHICILWQNYFFCQNKSLKPHYGVNLFIKNKDHISSFGERGGKSGTCHFLYGLAHVTSNKSRD